MGLLNSLSLTQEEYKPLVQAREQYMQEALRLKRQMERQRRKAAGIDNDDEDDEMDVDDNQSTANTTGSKKNDKSKANDEIKSCDDIKSAEIAESNDRMNSNNGAKSSNAIISSDTIISSDAIKSSDKCVRTKAISLFLQSRNKKVNENIFEKEPTGSLQK